MELSLALAGAKVGDAVSSAVQQPTTWSRKGAYLLNGSKTKILIIYTNAFLEHIRGTHAHIHAYLKKIHRYLKKNKNSKAVLGIMPVCWQKVGTWF